MMCRVHVFAALCAGVAATAVLAAQDLTHREADSMEQKLAAIEARAAKTKPAAAAARTIRTSFTERELNAYLQFNGHERLPKGLVNPRVTMAGDRRVSGRALVDLDEVRKSKPRSWFDPSAYLLTGVVEVQATGLLLTSAGKGTFQVETATVGSLAIPKSLLEELVTFYSRSSDLPGGIDLEKPFELPANIREVEILRGSATVIQ